MNLIKIDGEFINTDAIDMIYCDDDANMFVKYGPKLTSILLRSGKIIVAQARIEDVKKAVTEATEQFCPLIYFRAEGGETIINADKMAQNAQKKGRMEEGK